MRRLSKLFALIYMYLTSHFSHGCENGNNKVLIVSDGHAGDAFLYGSMIEAMLNHYGESGREAYIFCFSAMKKMLKILLAGRKDLNFIEIDNSYEYIENVKNLKETVRFYKLLKGLEFDEVIMIDGRTIFFNWAGTVVGANKRFIFLRSKYRNLHTFLRFPVISKYTKRFIFERETTNYCMSHKIMDFIGCKNFRYHTMNFEYVKDDKTKKYVAISVDSSSPARKWSIQKFVDISNYILDNYEFDIYITGINLTKEEEKIYYDKFSGNRRVKILIGKTSFEDLINILGNRELHIGVDSGPVNISSALGTQSICLSGMWDGHVFFPYIVDDIAPGTCLPLCVYGENVENYPCAWCKEKRAFPGKNNKNCMKAIKVGKGALCLQSISAENVIMAIEKYVNSIKVE